MHTSQFNQRIDNSPIYQPLRAISGEIAVLVDGLTEGVEQLCGYYLTIQHRNAIVNSIADILLEKARQHGTEDSSMGGN